MTNTARTLSRLWTVAEDIAREQCRFDGEDATDPDTLDEYTAAILDELVLRAEIWLTRERQENEQWGAQ